MFGGGANSVRLLALYVCLGYASYSTPSSPLSLLLRVKSHRRLTGYTSRGRCGLVSPGWRTPISDWTNAVEDNNDDGDDN